MRDALLIFAGAAIGSLVTTAIYILLVYRKIFGGDK